MHTNDRKNKTLYVDTVADMLALTGVPDGTRVDTARYSTSHTVGDGSGGTYVYDADSTATIDGGFVMPGIGGTLSFSGTTFNGTAGTGRWLLKDTTVANVMQFGAVGDGVTNDTIAITTAQQTGSEVVLVAGRTYICKLEITSGVAIISTNGTGRAKIKAPTGEPYAAFIGGDVATFNHRISNIYFEGNGKSTTDAACVIDRAINGVMNNCLFGASKSGLEIRRSFGWVFSNCGNAISATSENNCDYGVYMHNKLNAGHAYKYSGLCKFDRFTFHGRKVSLVVDNSGVGNAPRIGAGNLFHLCSFEQGGAIKAWFHLSGSMQDKNVFQHCWFESPASSGSTFDCSDIGLGTLASDDGDIYLAQESHAKFSGLQFGHKLNVTLQSRAFVEDDLTEVNHYWDATSSVTCGNVSAWTANFTVTNKDVLADMLTPWTEVGTLPLSGISYYALAGRVPYVPTGFATSVSDRMRYHNDPVQTLKLRSSSLIFTADATTDTITLASHPFSNGDVVRLAGSDLPAGLNNATDYHIINSASGTFQLSATSGGVAIDFTDNGSGNQYISNAWSEVTSTTLIGKAARIDARATDRYTLEGISNTPSGYFYRFSDTTGEYVLLTFRIRSVTGDTNVKLKTYTLTGADSGQIKLRGTNWHTLCLMGNERNQRYNAFIECVEDQELEVSDMSCTLWSDVSEMQRFLREGRIAGAP